MATNTVPLALYLWKRIYQLGVRSVFGVPGDFNMNLLDFIMKAGLHWVGTANELNAAYAADGYARVKHVPGVCLTTYGVGELSAVNGLAGSFSERIKNIHVVGTTSRSMKAAHVSSHHALGIDPDHDVYSKMTAAVRVAAADLRNVETAPQEIDDALRECFVRNAPIYIFFPMDMVYEPVPASKLDNVIDLSPVVDESNERAALDAVLAELYASKNPSFVVDALCDRCDANDETIALANKLGFPVYSTLMGKSIFDETSPLFSGMTMGDWSIPGLQQQLLHSDLILVAGYFAGDANTGHFTMGFTDTNSIFIYAESVRVKGKVYQGVHLKRFVSKLIETIDKTKLPQVPIPKMLDFPTTNDADATHITQSWIWNAVTKTLRANDVVLAEVGTAQFGMPDVRLPANVQYFSQAYWGSIGYATASCLGAEQAQRESGKGRTICLAGDGSFQMTSGEIGSMIRNKSQAIFYLLNNNGYTIERAIHGPTEKYNDIAQYRYSEMLNFFGAKDPKSAFRTASTKQEFERIISSDDDLANPPSLQVFEIKLEKMDLPRSLMLLYSPQLKN